MSARCARRDAQDHECGARPQAPDRALATGDHWRGAVRLGPSRGRVMAPASKRFLQSASVDGLPMTIRGGGNPMLDMALRAAV